MTTNRVMVTGAAGFIGSHLCEELVRRGLSVIGVDNLFRGKLENLRSLEGNKSFQLCQFDLADPASVGYVADLIGAHQPGQVFHHAAINGTQYFYDIPLEVLQKNMAMTSVLLDGLAQGGFQGKVIYASSSEVYGDPSAVPTPESEISKLRPDMDRDSYAASKVWGEMLVRLTSESHGWDWLALRIFNCYGPRMDTSQYGQVIPEFFKKSLSKGPFTLIGNGKQRRSFCYVDDMVWLTLECAERCNQDVFNVGSDSEIEIMEVASKIHQLVKREFEPSYVPARSGDHSRRCPSLAKVRSYLGDFQLIPLEEGLRKCLEYYAQRAGAGLV